MTQRTTASPSIRTRLSSMTSPWIFVAVVFYAIVNFIGELFALTPRADTFSMMLWCSAAIIVAFVISKRHSAQPYPAHQQSAVR